MNALVSPPPPVAPPPVAPPPVAPPPVAPPPVALPAGPLTEAEYLRIERTTAEGPRCEFDGARRLPMPGGSRRHVDIARRVEDALRALIAARPESHRAADPLTTYRSDLRLRVPAGRYRYPDVMVTPDPPAMLNGEQDTALNPRVIVEVLSPTTEHLDRGVKLSEYRAIPSLTDYLLLSQDEAAADHYRRTGGGESVPGEPGRWEVVSHAGRGAAAPLTGLGSFSLGAVFAAG